MTPGEALAECEAAVRRGDPDRYFASLFAPAEKRPLLFALYAFDRELARVVEVAREPMMAEIRLQWWREAVQDAKRGQSPVHPAALGLAEIFARANLLVGPFEQLIDAYASDVDFADCGALETRAESTFAAVMQIAASLLGASEHTDSLAREAGTAYGLARLTCAVSIAVASGELDTEVARNVIKVVAGLAGKHLSRARTERLPRHSRAAFLPAALAPAYLARGRRLRDPLGGWIGVSPIRRQLVLLRAVALGRL